MRVIILAAGIGSRLLPVTLARAKRLIELQGRPFLARTLELLTDKGCQDVVCVSGYYASSLEHALKSFARRPRLHFIRNPEFERTNSIVSLALTSEWWDRDFLLIDSDLWFEEKRYMPIL